MFDELGFSIVSYFLNKKTFQSVIDKSDFQKINLALDGIPDNDFLKLQHIEFAYTNTAIDFIRRKKIPPLTQLLFFNNFGIGQLFTYEGAFYFRNVNIKSNVDRRSFYIKLPEFSNIEIRGDFSTEHYTCNTAKVRLSGKSRVFLFGYIEDVKEKAVNIKPIIFGDRVLKSKDDGDLLAFNQLRVFPEDIDEFKIISKIDYGESVSEKAINNIKHIPEVIIKKHIADIIFENQVPKDWGGEKSDLYTTHLHINGKRVRAALILKGPSKFHIMQIKDLGKNGDQIIKLFDEIADLYILQHCHFISPTVEKIMESFASMYMRIKKYMILDGIDTFRLLKAYGKI